MNKMKSHQIDYHESESENVIIVGAFHEIIELVEDNGIEIIGMIDNERTESYRDYKIFCNDHGAQNLPDKLKKIPILITPDKPQLRQKLHNYYENSGFHFFSLISKRSIISKSSAIGKGTIVQSEVNVSAECNIGKFVKLNTFCNIMHNSIIEDYTTIAPNAVLLGNVKTGKLCYIGSNATILPNICICDNVVVGAGAVVTKDITTPGTYVGVPARLLKDI
tara:strand:- start:797 stop:1459 length:663 start_codon:yes stop_codon:yes gene_type:complete